MGRLRFDNRVAIVTGAANGLGRAYAEHLSALGAKVVVNDPAKVTCTTTKRAEYAADRLVKQLGEGRAVANYDSVTDGATVVQTALDTWGRVDILVNNAGIVRDASFAKMTREQWDEVYKVHLEGTMSVTKAAWNVMRDQQFGRIVNVSSASGLYGNFGQANYAAAKMGIAGLTFTLAKEGAQRNINVNVVAPLAASQMTNGIVDDQLFEKLDPHFVAPFVTYLCHETCKRSGNVYEVGAGWVARVRWQRASGVHFPANSFTIDAIAHKIDSIEDFETAPPSYPTSLQDSIETMRELSGLSEQ
ncbi:TPA: hypothetical protein N0F65_009997 [Lagenidium giganteum]|uniref:Ketoreductase domain-containing protein n=1 Tax=Lagenidium giganteum TaxID=4803 RepID=A0AAV2ZDS0_9STRA|nr:TPA: hypothetical protein N0F65_009997 [Lagenidium giganteum]